MFKGHHFDASLILLCVRWYLSYGLSLRNLEEMIAERGISVDHSPIHRWVLRYAPKLLTNFNRCKRPVSGKWHMDETYIKVKGECHELRVRSGGCKSGRHGPNETIAEDDGELSFCHSPFTGRHHPFFL